MHGTNTHKEKQRLLEKAEAYFQELEEARSNLERKSKDYGFKLAIILIAGFLLMSVFKLLASDEPSTKKKTYSAGSDSRFFKAVRAIALPFILKGMKNIVLPDTSKNNEEDAD